MRERSIAENLCSDDSFVEEIVQLIYFVVFLLGWNVIVDVTWLSKKSLHLVTLCKLYIHNIQSILLGSDTILKFGSRIGLRQPNRGMRRVRFTCKIKAVSSQNHLTMGGVTPKLIKWYYFSFYFDVRHWHMHTHMGFNIQSILLPNDSCEKQKK